MDWDNPMSMLFGVPPQRKIDEVDDDENDNFYDNDSNQTRDPTEAGVSYVSTIPLCPLTNGLTLNHHYRSRVARML
jgi:hypothetical protein